MREQEQQGYRCLQQGRIQRWFTGARFEDFWQIAIIPGSMLGTKMVKEAFVVAGGDIRIGAEILTRAVLSDEFESATGQYFDNDSGQFASPHSDALDPEKLEAIVRIIEAVLVERTQSGKNHL